MPGAVGNTPPKDRGQGEGALVNTSRKAGRGARGPTPLAFPSCDYFSNSWGFDSAQKNPL